MKTVCFRGKRKTESCILLSRVDRWRWHSSWGKTWRGVTQLKLRLRQRWEQNKKGMFYGTTWAEYCYYAGTSFSAWPERLFVYRCCALASGPGALRSPTTLRIRQSFIFATLFSFQYCICTKQNLIITGTKNFHNLSNRSYT